LNREDETQGILKVVNGSILSSSSTIQAVEDNSIQRDGLRVDNHATIVMRRNTGEEHQSLISLPRLLDLDDYPIIRDPPIESTRTTNITPSLITIERAVATKVYFETYYHGVFKKPSSREQRKSLLEDELGRLNISDSEKRNVRCAFVAAESEHLRSIRTRVHIGESVFFRRSSILVLTYIPFLTYYRKFQEIESHWSRSVWSRFGLFRNFHW
jgi:protein-serine/threonine kinase